MAILASGPGGAVPPSPPPGRWTVPPLSMFFPAPGLGGFTGQCLGLSSERVQTLFHAAQVAVLAADAMSQEAINL